MPRNAILPKKTAKFSCNKVGLEKKNVLFIIRFSKLLMFLHG